MIGKFLKIFLVPVLFTVIALQLSGAEDDGSLGASSYKLPASCMRYFRLAQTHRADTLGIVYSDSMRAEALRINHKESYVISYLGPMYYHCATYNITQMEVAARKLREEALKAGEMRYVYASYTTLMDAHIARRAYSNAIQIGNEMYSESEKRGDKYGKWSSQRKIAEIYEAMGNTPSAREALLKTIELWPQLNKKASSTYLYCRLARIEPSLSKRLEIIKKGEEFAKTYYDSAQINTAMLRYYAESQDAENYHNLYQKIKSHRNFPAGYNQIMRVEFEAYDRLFSKGKQEALDYFTENEELVRRDYFTYMKLTNLYVNDYEQAYYWHEKEDSVLKAKQADVMVNDIYTYNTRLLAKSVNEAVKEKDMELQLAMQEKAVAEAERARIEAENARLSAERQRAESEKLKTFAEAEKHKAQAKLLEAEAENGRMKLEKEKQELARVRAQKKAAQMEAEGEHAAFIMSVLTASSILLILIILATLYYARKQRKIRLHIEKLNEELQAAQAAERKANELKNVFIQNMSHEIRTPMNAIMGFSQLLTTPGISLSEEEKEEYGRHITTNVNMLHTMVEDILNVSDIETGRFEITIKNVEVQDICKEANSMIANFVPSNVKYIYENGLPELFSCNTDAIRVQQVLVNYLTNACKHTVEGSITLQTKLDEERKKVVFSVTDTGTGVPTDKATEIFERFTKVDSFKQGMGLGLSVCHAIAKRLDGKAWLDTSYTNGARFCFEIPSDAKQS